MQKKFVNCSYTAEYVYQKGRISMEDHLWFTVVALS